MRQRPRFPIVFVFCAALLAMSMPRPFVEKLQSGAVALFSPLWQWALKSKAWAKELPAAGSEDKTAEILKLKVENRLLKNQLQSQGELLKAAFSKDIPGIPIASHKKIDLVPAKVIYRPATTWNSSLWLNVGQETNKAIGTSIIAKGSPVVVGNSLVGVIDYVGKNQARVCLITDPSLVPSVRALRGQPQRRYLADTIAGLKDNLIDIEDLFSSEQEKLSLAAKLEELEKKLLDSNGALSLAKGELHGSSAPLWRSPGSYLQGIGFNCDFADEFGPARDLRRGTPYGDSPRAAPLPLLQKHDLLVTTGMDGVFPPGLHVAEVVYIHPLKEGDYFYELLAKPTVINLDELSVVFVLPPYGYDPQDQPPLYSYEK